MLARTVISAVSNSDQKPASSAWEGQAFWAFVQAFKQERQCKFNPKLGLIDVEVVYLQIIGGILSGTVILPRRKGLALSSAFWSRVLYILDQGSPAAVTSTPPKLDEKKFRTKSISLEIVLSRRMSSRTTYPSVFKD
jgi:hypothetical protein